MATTLDTLPEAVRSQAAKMRELLRIIENAPVKQVVPAIAALKGEVDKLVTCANEASGLRL